MGAYECRVATILTGFLEIYTRANRIGRVAGETLFNLRPAVNRERRPDLAFVSFERCPRNRKVPSDAAWAVVPDLAVEVISPEVMVKLKEYFLAGVQRV